MRASSLSRLALKLGDFEFGVGQVRSIVRILIVLVAAWLQISFFGAFRIFDVMPNILLIVIIYAGLIADASDTLTMALVGGLLLDLASGVDFGLRMAFYTLLGLLIVIMRRAGTDFENTGMVLAATLGGTIMYDAVVVTGMVLGHIAVPWPIVIQRVIIEVILNCLLALLLRRPLSRMLGRAELSLGWRRRTGRL